MPLSEQEQRLLDEMERNLYKNDADVVTGIGERRGRPSYRSIVIGALVVLAGIGGLVVGVIISQPLIGIGAFAVMLAGVMIAITPSKDQPESVGAPARGSSQQKPRDGRSFTERMNDRWENRQ